MSCLFSLRSIPTAETPNPTCNNTNLQGPLGPRETDTYILGVCAAPLLRATFAAFGPSAHPWSLQRRLRSLKHAEQTRTCALTGTSLYDPGLLCRYSVSTSKVTQVLPRGHPHFLTLDQVLKSTYKGKRQIGPLQVTLLSTARPQGGVERYWGHLESIFFEHALHLLQHD
eukprot:3529315-Amphidinium_carterae.3